MRKENDYRFEWAVLKHLDAAYNLARRLLGNDQDAEDVVQDSAIRAFDSFKSFRGVEGKAWFLAIVRNASYNHLRSRTPDRHLDLEFEVVPDETSPSPEELVIRAWEGQEIEAALGGLPTVYREILVLRELEDMSYKQISTVTGLPIGTVMSRLARARQRMQMALSGSASGEAK